MYISQYKRKAKVRVFLCISCELQLIRNLGVGGEGGQRHASAALPLGMTWYPLYRRLCAPLGQSGCARKVEARTVQPLACRYTDYAIPAARSSRDSSLVVVVVVVVMVAVAVAAAAVAVVVAVVVVVVGGWWWWWWWWWCW